MGKLGSVLYVTELTRFKVLWQRPLRMNVFHYSKSLDIFMHRVFYYIDLLSSFTAH